MRLWRRKKITCCFPTYQIIKIPYCYAQPIPTDNPLGKDENWALTHRGDLRNVLYKAPKFYAQLGFGLVVWYIYNKQKFVSREFTFNFDLSPYSLHSGTITLYVTWWYTGYQGLRPQQSLGDNSIDFPLIFDGIEENFKNVYSISNNLLEYLSEYLNIIFSFSLPLFQKKNIQIKDVFQATSSPTSGPWVNGWKNRWKR